MTARQLLRRLATEGKLSTKGIRPIARELQSRGLAQLNKSETAVTLTKAGKYTAAPSAKAAP